MKEQEIYDRSLDPPALPPPGSVSAPAAALPNEPYYQRPAARRGARNASLGVALVVVGLLLLAFQLLGRGVALGGGAAIPLVDQRLSANRIELTAAASDVEVRAADGTQIQIEAIQHGGSRGDYTIDVGQSGGTVQVSETSNSLFCIFCSRHVSYRIAVPSGAAAQIKTASGSIDVAGLSGAVELSTVSGDVRANDLTGGLTVGTTSGEVRLDNVQGQLEVSTISGDVRLEDGKITAANVSTTSGEVELDGVAGPLTIGTVSGDVRVRDASASRLTVNTTSGEFEFSGGLDRGGANSVSSISGDVKLELPSDSGVRLDASTVSGSISSDFDLSNREEGRRSLKGAIGDGAADLTIGTTSGDISIERR